MGLLTRTQGMGVAALALGFSVFLSRILGLVRDKVISFYFGAGAEADIYFTAFVLPDFLNYLLAGGYFSITLVPLLSMAFNRGDENGWSFFSSAVSWAALAILFLTVLAWVLVPYLVTIIAPGFSPEHQARLELFLRIILPAQVCFLPGACFSAMLYYRRQFTVPALTPLVYNGCIILCGVIFIHVFPGRGMEGFCWGVLLGALLGSLVLPVMAVRAGGLRLFPKNEARLLHPGMKRLLILALPLMLGQSVVALDEQFVRIFGSLTGEGGVSLLNYARRIMLVPVGVIAQAAGLASFPFLAALAAERKYAEFDASLKTALGNTLLVALPLSLWMMTASEAIMRLIFQQGSFSSEDAEISGILLAIMLSVVVFWSVQQIIGRAFYARQDTLTPALIGTAATVLSLPLYYFGAVRYGAAGVAVAGSLAVVLYTSGLQWVWRRRFGREGLEGVAILASKSLLLCLPAMAGSWAVNKSMLPVFAENSLTGAFLRICASGLVFNLLYFGLARLLAPEVGAPFRALFSRLLRKAA